MAPNVWERGSRCRSGSTRSLVSASGWAEVWKSYSTNTGEKGGRARFRLPPAGVTLLQAASEIDAAVAPAGTRPCRYTVLVRARFFALVALVTVAMVVGGASCGSREGGTASPGPTPDQRAEEKGDASTEETTFAYRSTPEYTNPGTVSSSANAVTASPSTSAPSTGQDSWAQQAGHHYRVSLSTLTDALHRLDPTHERIGEDYSAMFEDELSLQAAAQGFRSLDPPPELEEANGYLREASDSLYNLSYDLTGAYNSFYPSGRLDAVAEEVLSAVEKLDAANRSARERGVDLDPHSEVPDPIEVRRLFLRLETKSEALERREKLPKPKGCSEEDPCPI
jgi:hypothetical protein